MALNNVKLFLEFEPIVKLTCNATDCHFNLMNAKNSDERQAACNLKQITIYPDGKCGNYSKKVGK